MAVRHWHWMYRIGDYTSMFTYPDRESIEQSLGERMFYEPEPEIYEAPCTCYEPIYIGVLEDK